MSDRFDAMADDLLGRCVCVEDRTGCPPCEHGADIAAALRRTWNEAIEAASAHVLKHDDCSAGFIAFKVLDLKAKEPTDG